MKIEKPIILTEFPKSGGTWVVSMIGEALQLPRRDIYVKQGFKLFSIESHPWYRGAASLDIPAQAVIKSHELPNSSLINFDAQYIHLVRDGRDVAISKWFFDQDFCVQNGIATAYQKNFDTYIQEVASAWSGYVNTWKSSSVITVRYEDFLADPVLTLELVLKKVTNHDFSSDYLKNVVAKFTKEKLSASLDETFQHNTFVRKGASGDWRNHFTKSNVDSFKLAAGDALISHGYEAASDWSI